MSDTGTISRATIRFKTGIQQTININKISQEHFKRFYDTAPDGTKVPSLTIIDMPGSLDIVMLHSNPTAGRITIPKADLQVFMNQYQPRIDG